MDDSKIAFRIIFVKIYEIVFISYQNLRESFSFLFPVVVKYNLLVLQANCGGILRGIGLHAFGAIFNFIGYYVITLPISIPLMLRTHLGVSGKMQNK